ncbi:uncharacterized protein LOC121421457 [Lytechinus variegatus]|uniref:uncharacterized protein LOC121421457 n=1 Tax=Lytechinus variegatus TaxID=7654 RepID=UPI001BB295C8|nr:uncharacterized protein LOC121421457 [Lytechinus variegatus]
MLRLSSICRRAGAQAPVTAFASRALIGESTPEFRGRASPCNRPFLQNTSSFHTHFVLSRPVPDLPDFNTSVNIHEHKLNRPVKPTKNTNAQTQKKKERAKLGSLIPETLKEMENDEEFKITAQKLKQMGQAKLTREERKKRQRALDNLGVPNFRDFLKQYHHEETGEKCSSLLRKIDIEILQLNIGLYCNQACNHCHVESSPRRKEMMDRETAEKCIDILEKSPNVHTLDLTGGAPELCSQFRYLASEGRRLGRKVIDRCNLTALLEPGQEDTPEFMAELGVTVIASLPCYSAKNVNLQRGSQVFQRSVAALQTLNELGYGQPGSGLELHLVYNPLGGFLPPPQGPLEQKYKEELDEAFGIKFNNLFTITNVPVKRFTDFLVRRNELEDYMNMLVRNFNPAAVEGLMCRNYINVGWDGRIFDCDLNQQLDLSSRRPLNIQSDTSGHAIPSGLKGPSIWDITSATDFADLGIVTDNHCFGCTAGSGSSCQGATV